MNILTYWLRSYLPELPVDDRQLAEDLTLRGIAVEGEFAASCGGALYEMDITTNRVDAMNHYGVAREAAAIYNVALAPIAETAAIAGVAHSSTAPSSMSGEQGFPVRIEADDLCGRFTARVIRGVTVGPATGQIADYFAAIGQKPISAPVDVTNFGWLAMGQPTHVFDLDTIEGGILVRRAKAGEKLRLLDGSERTLVAEDLVVADEKKALGLAGVMGGWDSRVTEATKNILVEAAWFDPAAIRASSRRHGLHTDASHRFERGADFNAAPLANNLVTRLVVAQSGGEVVGPMTDIIIPAIAAKTADRAPITLHVCEVARHLGATADGNGISEELVAQYLTALGCKLTPLSFRSEAKESASLPATTFEVQLPSWRLDLEREIDLIEEIARVHGYNRFANTLPSFTGSVVELPHAAQERAIRSTLLALGFTEAISSTFCAIEEAATFADAAQTVPLGNPLSAEAGVLRPSLAPGMATMLAHNLHRDVATVRLFELGTIFTGSTRQVAEHTSLSLGLTGNAQATALYKAEDALLYEAKSALTTLLAKFAGAITFDSELPAWITPGRGARILLEGAPIAVFGELTAAELQSRKLRQPCVVASVDAHTLLATPLRQPSLRELSRFQAVERDFSFVFPDSVQWHSITAALTALAIPELQRMTPVEIFREAKSKDAAKGKAVPSGSYSLLTRVVFQSPERTLTEDELTAWNAQIVTALTSLGGTQRA
jgi:phenylalanyl-tRNA synthetase beta chain